MTGDKKTKTSMAKIAVVYTICNLLVKGIAFITTPLFTRLMTKSEFGDFSNISSWVTIVTVITTADLYASINTAKYDFEGRINDFLSSIMLLSNIITLVCYGVVEININFFTLFFSMEPIYIRFMFIYLLFSPAVSFLQTKSRIYNEYKSVIALTFLTVLTSVGASIFLMLIMKDALLARVLGNYVVIAAIDVGIWFYVLNKGRTFQWKYCKYALKLSVPLIPHNLAGNLLISSDRIIIKRLCGAEDAALYSLAYTIATIASIFLTSLNQAWVPWLYDHINKKNYKEIYDKSKYYVGVFCWMSVGAVLISPEIIMIFGGKDYYEAKYVIAPVIVGVMLQFIYTLYVNIEFYMKKTSFVSLMTVLAAGANILLNYWLIPIFGYMAAAYTTILGYAFMALGHFIIVRVFGKYTSIYDGKAIIAMVGLMFGLIPLAYLVCDSDSIRYVCWAIYGVASTYVLYKNKKTLLAILKRGK